MSNSNDTYGIPGVYDSTAGGMVSAPDSIVPHTHTYRPSPGPIHTINPVWTNPNVLDRTLGADHRAYARMPAVAGSSIMARRGSVQIEASLIEKDPVAVQAVFARLIPVRVEHDFMSQRLNIDAVSADFEPLNHGEKMPMYTVSIYTNADPGTIPRVKFQKINPDGGFDEALMLEQPRVYEADNMELRTIDERKDQQDADMRAAVDARTKALESLQRARNAYGFNEDTLEQVASAPASALLTPEEYSKAMMENTKNTTLRGIVNSVLGLKGS